MLFVYNDFLNLLLIKLFVSAFDKTRRKKRGTKLKMNNGERMGGGKGQTIINSDLQEYCLNKKQSGEFKFPTGPEGIGGWGILKLNKSAFAIASPIK